MERSKGTVELRKIIKFGKKWINCYMCGLPSRSLCWYPRPTWELLLILARTKASFSRANLQPMPKVVSFLEAVHPKLTAVSKLGFTFWWTDPPKTYERNNIFKNYVGFTSFGIHSGPENLKKSRPKKLFKWNKSISRNFFLAKIHFLPFQKWPKINFWTGESAKNAI